MTLRKVSDLFEWWFSPWVYSKEQAVNLILSEDTLALRDAYKFWCHEMNIVSNFPPKVDQGWNILIDMDYSLIERKLHLFAGIVAARHQDNFILKQMSTDDRQWCLRIASIQPIQRNEAIRYSQHDSTVVRGACELKWHVESSFPGAWSRIRLMLDKSIVKTVDQYLSDGDVGTCPKSARRAQQCWKFCLEKIESFYDSCNTSATWK